MFGNMPLNSSIPVNLLYADTDQTVCHSREGGNPEVGCDWDFAQRFKSHSP